MYQYVQHPKAAIDKYTVILHAHACWLRAIVRQIQPQVFLLPAGVFLLAHLSLHVLDIVEGLQLTSRKKALLASRPRVTDGHVRKDLIPAHLPHATVGRSQPIEFLLLIQTLLLECPSTVVTQILAQHGVELGVELGMVIAEETSLALVS